MRSLVVREAALNMYFKDGKSYQFVAKALDVPLDTVKSWCLRYRKKREFHSEIKQVGEKHLSIKILFTAEHPEQTRRKTGSLDLRWRWIYSEIF